MRKQSESTLATPEVPTFFLYFLTRAPLLPLLSQLLRSLDPREPWVLFVGTFKAKGWGPSVLTATRLSPPPHGVEQKAGPQEGSGTRCTQAGEVGGCEETRQAPWRGLGAAAMTLGNTPATRGRPSASTAPEHRCTVTPPALQRAAPKRAPGGKALEGGAPSCRPPALSSPEPLGAHHQVLAAAPRPSPPSARHLKVHSATSSKNEGDNLGLQSRPTRLSTDACRGFRPPPGCPVRLSPATATHFHGEASSAVSTWGQKPSFHQTPQVLGAPGQNTKLLSQSLHSSATLRCSCRFLFHTIGQHSPAATLNSRFIFF